MKKTAFILIALLALVPVAVMAAGIEDYVVGYWRFNDTSTTSGLTSYFDSYVPGPGLVIIKNGGSVKSNNTMQTYAGPFGNGVRDIVGDRYMLLTNRWDNRFAQEDWTVSEWVYVNHAEESGAGYIWSVGDGNTSNAMWFRINPVEYNATTYGYNNVTLQLGCMESAVSVRKDVYANWHLFTVTYNSTTNAIKFYIDGLNVANATSSSRCRIDDNPTYTNNIYGILEYSYKEFNFTVGGIQGLTAYGNLTNDMFGPTLIFASELNASDVLSLNSSIWYLNTNASSMKGKLDVLPHSVPSSHTSYSVTTYPMRAAIGIGSATTADTVKYFVSSFSNLSYLNQPLGSKRSSGSNYVNFTQGGYSFYWNQTIFNRWGSLSVNNLNVTTSYDYVPSFILGTEYPLNNTRSRRLADNVASFVFWQKDSGLGQSFGIGIDDNNLTVKLYFGETNPPPLYSTFSSGNLSLGEYYGNVTLPSLLQQHIYYWKIVVDDGVNKNTTVPVDQIYRFESTQYCVEPQGCGVIKYATVNTTNVMKFSAPSTVTADALYYWDFRNGSLAEFYTGTMGTNLSVMGGLAGPFGGNGIRASIDTLVAGPAVNSYNWSYMGWVYVNQSLGTHYVWKLSDPNNDYVNLQYVAGGPVGYMYLNCRDASSGAGYGSWNGMLEPMGIAVIPRDTWAHVAIVHTGLGSTDASSMTKIYVNGANVRNVTPYYRCRFNVKNSPQFYAQAVGPTAFYDRAITDAQVSGMYNSGGYYDWLSFNNPPYFVSQGPPTNGSVNQSSPNITVSWSAADLDSHPITYAVLLGTSNPPSTIVVPSTQNTSALLTGLSGLTTYYWLVEAVDSLGAQTNSSVYQFTTMNTAPYTLSPSPASGATGVNRTTGLSWVGYDNESQVLHYNVYFGTNESDLSLLSFNQLQTTYPVQSLQANTTYYWRVVANDTLDAYTNGTLWNFTTSYPELNATYPADNQLGLAAGNITLQWSAYDPDGNNLSFSVYLSSPLNSTPSLLVSNITALNYSANLTGHATYNWYVVGNDTYGISFVGPVFNFSVANTVPSFVSSSPAQEASFSVNGYLTYNFSDFDGDDLKYTPYIGKYDGLFTVLLPQMQTNIPKFLPGGRGYELPRNTKFTWYGIASDGHGGNNVSELRNLTTTGNIVPLMNLAELRSDRSVSTIYNDQDAYVYCQADNDAFFTYSIYRNGVLNRTGTGVTPINTFQNRATISATSVGQPFNTVEGTVAVPYATASVIGWEICNEELTSCSNHPFDSGSFFIEDAFQLRAGGAGKLFVLYKSNFNPSSLYAGYCDVNGDGCSVKTISTLVYDEAVAAQEFDGTIAVVMKTSDVSRTQTLRECRPDGNFTEQYEGCSDSIIYFDGDVVDVVQKNMYTSNAVYFASTEKTLNGTVVEVKTSAEGANAIVDAYVLRRFAPGAQYSVVLGFSGPFPDSNENTYASVATVKNWTSSIITGLSMNRLSSNMIAVTYVIDGIANLMLCQPDGSDCVESVLGVASQSGKTGVREMYDKRLLLSFIDNTGKLQILKTFPSFFDNTDAVKVATIDRTDLDVGSNWSVTCTPDDARGDSVWTSSTIESGVGTPLASSTYMVVFGGNNPPNAPFNEYPSSGAVNVSIDPVLTWNATDPESNTLVYDVYFGTSNETWTKVASGLSNSLFNTSGLTNGHTQYVWMVTATDTGDASTNSSVWNFTTVNRLPVVIPSIANNSASVSRFSEVSWSGSDDDGDALVYSAWFGSSPSNLTQYVNGTATSAFAPAMLSGRTYYWVVNVSDARDVASSGLLQFTTANTAPGATLVAPTNGFAGASRNPTLSWTGVDAESDLLNYKVYFDTVNPPQNTLTNSTASTSIGTSGLSLSTTYYWRVQANDSLLQGNSSVFSFATAVNYAPATPSNPLLWAPSFPPGTDYQPLNGYTNAPVSNVHLQWESSDANSDLMTFYVYIGTTPGNLLLNTTIAGSTRYGTLTLGLCSYLTCTTPLAYGATYYVQIVASDGMVNSTGPVWSFTTRQERAPTVTLVSPTNGRTGVPVTTTASWSMSDPDSDPLSVVFWFGLSASNLTGMSLGSATSKGLWGLSPLTTYYWKVNVSDGIGGSAESAVWSFTTASIPVPPPPSPPLPPVVDPPVCPGCNGENNVTVICGNGVIEGYEQCDGTAPAGFTCQGCRLVKDGTVCGNNVTEPSEECDNTATIPAGMLCYKCQLFYRNASVNNTPICGNDVVELGEQCDGVASTPPGYSCIACKLNLDTSICGNGVVEVGETCDGPDSTPTGYSCVQCKLIPNTQPTCGDNVLQYPEQCDGPETTPVGLQCINCKLFDNTTTPVCGDSIVTPPEECDGSAPTGYSCVNCYLVPVTVPEPAVCGNGIREQLEECDGSAPVGYTCVDCRLVGQPAVCGNGVLELGEMCDDGNNVNGDGCSSVCRTEEPVPTYECGNGLKESGEECDDGNVRSGDGCSASCEWEHICGNGVLENGESCDDGNLVGGDGCSSACTREGRGGGGGGGGGTPTIIDGHNYIWVYKWDPATGKQVYVLVRAMGSNYKCATNPAAANCGGKAAYLVGNERTVSVNGENKTYQDFLCLDPVSNEVLEQYSIGIKQCPNELYTADLNGDGTSDVVTYGGVYDVKNKVILQQFSGHSSEDVVIPVGISGDGGMSVVWSSLSSNLLGVYKSGAVNVIAPATAGFISVNPDEQRIDIEVPAFASATCSADIYWDNGDGERIYCAKVEGMGCGQMSTSAGALCGCGDYYVNVTQRDIFTGVKIYYAFNANVPDSACINPIVTTNRCSITPDGEFNYHGTPAENGWSANSVVDGNRYYPSGRIEADGRVAYLRNGDAMEHALDCDKRYVEVSTKVGMYTSTGYNFDVKVYGYKTDKTRTGVTTTTTNSIALCNNRDVNGECLDYVDTGLDRTKRTTSAYEKPVLLGGFAIKDESDRNKMDVQQLLKQNKNLYVFTDSTNTLGAMEPIGYMSAFDSCVNGELTLSGSDKLEVVEVRDGEKPVLWFNIMNLLSKSSVSGYANLGDAVKNYKLGSNTYAIQFTGFNEKEVNLTVNNAKKTIARSDPRLVCVREVKMVFDLYTKEYTVQYETSPGVFTTDDDPKSFVTSDFDGMASVIVENAHNLNNDIGSMVVLDYVRTLGRGEKVNPAVLKDDTRKLKEYAFSMLDTCSNDGSDVDEEYQKIVSYCVNLQSTGLEKSKYCSLASLRDAIYYNNACYRGALKYCKDVTFAKTQGLTADDMNVASDASKPAELDGAAGCMMALQISSANDNLLLPMASTTWRLIKGNWPVLLVVFLFGALMFVGMKKR